MKSIIANTLASFLCVGIVMIRLDVSQAFVVMAPLTMDQPSQLFLRPNQAADLEACAYDLMKADVEKKKAESLTTSKSAHACPSTGGSPILAWCRRRKFVFGASTRHTTNQASAASGNTECQKP